MLEIFLRITKHVFPFNSARYFAYIRSGLYLSFLDKCVGYHPQDCEVVTNQNIKNILVIQGDELLVMPFF